MNEKWKAVEPEETLKIIDNILSENQIYTDIQWYGMTEQIQSCRLHLLNGKGVNGKGLTPAYTLASGKAELLERLQTFQMTPVPPQRRFKDEILLNSCYQLPYFNCTDGSVKYFPQFISTNGLASGNTLDEAIVHALCELIERYAYLQLAKQQLNFHKELDIPKEYKTILDKLDAKGKLIDISMFNVPIALFYLETRNGFIDIEIDCGPTLDIAIERCFTEMLQGIDLERMDFNRFSIIGNNSLSDEEFFHSIVFLVSICIPERYVSYILNCSYDNKLSLYDYIDNKGFIKNVIQNTHDIFGDIYIRDYSFLGFPTVRCAFEYSYENLFEKDEIHFYNILSYLSENLIENTNPHIESTYHEVIGKINFLSAMMPLDNYYNNTLFEKLKEKSLDFEMDFSLFDDIIRR